LGLFHMQGKSILLALILLTIIAIALSLSFGTTFISPQRLVRMIVDGGDSMEYLIVMQLRLPRAIMALLVGASLAVSGVLFQALLKNPLSDPYTIGISGGAALGATIAVVASLGYFFISIFAFAGSILTILLVFSLSSSKRFGTTSLILTGIALSFILSSGVLLIFALTRAQHVHKALLWLMGDLSLARYKTLVQMSVIIPIIIISALFYFKHLDAISLGDTFAKNLGVTRRDMRNIFWIASLLSAISVSMAGIIGFVGLIVPHIMRFFFGPNHFKLVLSSAIGGGVLLVICDLIGRTVAPPYEIPVGIITGFVGGIFFLFLIITKGERSQ
jgi:iron complex transport system permease protein